MRWIKSVELVKFNSVVSENDSFSVVNVVNWGRSNDSNRMTWLFNDTVFVSLNVEYPTSNLVNLGRSESQKQRNQTC